MRSLHVDGGEEVDGGAGFDEEEDFGGRDYVGEIGDGLLDAVVEDVEVFAAEVGDEVPLGVGDGDADVDAVDGDLDGGGLVGGLRGRKIYHRGRGGHGGGVG